MLYRIDFKHFFWCRATLFNDHGCGYPVFGQINHKLRLMLFRRNAPPPPWFAAPITVLLSILPAWEAWAVLSSGSMEGINCSGAFSGTLCAAGALVGRVLFGEQRVHYGYAVVAGAFVVLLLYMSYGLRSRFRKGQRRET